MVKGVGQITIVDLNDALIAGEPPLQPEVGALWIDTSPLDDDPPGIPVLKRWNGTQWVPQTLSLADLDPEKNEMIEEVTVVKETLYTAQGSIVELADLISLSVTTETFESRTELIDGIVADHTARLDTTESTLDVLDKAIKLSVTQEAYGVDMDGVKDRLEHAEGELELQAEKLEARFSLGGGVNILRNSVGYGYTDFWKTIGEGIISVGYSELQQYGASSAFLIGTAGTTDILEQSFFVLPFQEYTVSTYVRKTNAASIGSLMVYQGDVDYNASTSVVLVNDSLTGQQLEYEQKKYTFVSAENKVTLRLSANASANVLFASTMINLGPDALQWTMHAEEKYSGSVRFDAFGVKVFRKGEHGRDVAYSEMSSEEFAGYFDTNDDGNFEKVFGVSGEETFSKKFRAQDEITMGGIKIIPLETATHSGWAFVPTAE